MKEIKFIVSGGNKQTGELKDVSYAIVPDIENFKAAMDIAAQTNALSTGEKWAAAYIKRDAYETEEKYQEAYKQFIAEISWSWLEVST